MFRRHTLLAILFAFCIALPQVSPAQEKETGKPVEKPWTFYKLTMTVREMDGAKTLNSRTYEFSQRSGEWGQLRVGSRVPVATGPANSTTQYQYLDVGLKVDSRVQERDNDVAFDWRLELSSAASSQSEGLPPVIRNVSSNGQTMLSMGKPVMLTSVDDTSSTHKFVFEVTTAKVK